MHSEGFVEVAGREVRIEGLVVLPVLDWPLLPDFGRPFGLSHSGLVFLEGVAGRFGRSGAGFVLLVLSHEILRHIDRVFGFA